jgi:hypothetical protein
MKSPPPRIRLLCASLSLILLAACQAAPVTIKSQVYAGLPSAIQPATLTQHVNVASSAITNNGAVTSSVISASVAPSSGTVTFYIGGSSSSWTAGLTGKGFSSGASISYILN